MQTSLGLANRCGQSPVIRGRHTSDSDRKAGQKAARTSARRTAADAAGAAWAHLRASLSIEDGQPVYRYRAIQGSVVMGRSSPWGLPVANEVTKHEQQSPPRRHSRREVCRRRINSTSKMTSSRPGCEWKAGYAVHQSARYLSCPKTLETAGEAASATCRLVADISGRGYRDAEPDDPRDLVERSEMLARDGEDV